MGEVPVEGTPTLGRVYNNNDVPYSLECMYLYYFNELTLLGPISGIDHTYGCII